MLFDSHAHYTDQAFDEDRELLLQGLQEKGIAYVMNPAGNLKDAELAVKLADKYDFFYCAVGSHPDSADEVDDAITHRYRTWAQTHSKVKAIGEIGLDYHYEDIPRDLQKQAFYKQMALAQEVKLPVIVHDRDAHEDAMDIVRAFSDVKGVFHCYSGAWEQAKALVDNGWYIGFTGVLTFKNAKRALDVASKLPMDRILLETDCPYMAPEPFRGKRNDSGLLYRMAEVLADIRGVSYEEIGTITTQNAKRLYRIDQ